MTEQAKQTAAIIPLRTNREAVLAQARIALRMGQADPTSSDPFPWSVSPLVHGAWREGQRRAAIAEAEGQS